MADTRADRSLGYDRNVVELGTLSRSGLVASMLSRISWGSVLAGFFVAIATQIALSALGLWAGFGLANLTSLNSISSAATGVAVWVGISALISLFVAGVVAARLASATTIRGGLWHGLTVWGVATSGTLLLSLSGVSGIAGFGLSNSGLLKAVSAPSTATLSRTTGATATYAGYYLLFTALGLVAALVGGWLGSYVIGRRARRASIDVAPEVETTSRRAA